MMTIGGLFSGYGGIELGLERTGHFKTLWHCEIEDYPSAILEERWPEAPNIGDITKVDWERIQKPDILTGGFPCQDISQAGRMEGIKKGENRSGLWGEFHKAIRILRPKLILIENVSALANNRLNIVLADLAKEGYDAEWLDIRASDFGAPHKRERIFIVAYKTRVKRSNPDSNGSCEHSKFTVSNERKPDERSEPAELCDDVPDADSTGLEAKRPEQPTTGAERCDYKATNSTGEGLERSEYQEGQAARHNHWEVEPDMGRVVDGTARGLDSYIWRERIKALGNGVVPQIPEWIGKKIVEARIR